MTPQQLLAARISDRLVKARQARKLNQTVVGDRLQMHRNSVSRWETGETPIGLYEFILYCEAVGERPAAVLGEILAARKMPQRVELPIAQIVEAA